MESKTNSRNSNCLFTPHMQISSQFRKPGSPIKQTHPKYITSPPIGCTRQEVGSLHSLETPLHSPQQTYLRPSIHTTQNFKWSRYTLTTLNISQLKTSSRQHIYKLQNSWHGHKTLHSVHHKHNTLSPHRRCERTLHSLVLVHWWPQRTTNSRCHQQLGPHNTKHTHHTTTNIITRYHHGV